MLPYVEAGLWLVVNIGGGYTIDVTEGETNASGPHLFLGLPLPFRVSERESITYCEPYYRATFSSAGTLHEGGVFVKWAKWE